MTNLIGGGKDGGQDRTVLRVTAICSLIKIHKIYFIFLTTPLFEAYNKYPFQLLSLSGTRSRSGSSVIGHLCTCTTSRSLTTETQN